MIDRLAPSAADGILSFPALAEESGGTQQPLVSKSPSPGPFIVRPLAMCAVGAHTQRGYWGSAEPRNRRKLFSFLDSAVGTPGSIDQSVSLTGLTLRRVCTSCGSSPGDPIHSPEMQSGIGYGSTNSLRRHILATALMAMSRC